MLINGWQWKPRAYGAISLCMIMRNEEKLLERCLRSVEGLADEIIIVDTGSTDKSIEIAKQFGAKVISTEWKDDFATPRNIGIAQAKNPWILIIDPDEVIAKKDHRRVRELTVSKESLAYRMDTRNYTQNVQMQGGVPNPNDYEEGQGWAGFVPSTKTRLFRRSAGLKFRGRWHEMVDYDIDKGQVRVQTCSVQVHHYGGEKSQEYLKSKREFYLNIAELKVKDDPKNCQAWWELGVAESISGYHNRAIRSILLSFRQGYANPDRLFQLAANANAIGDKKRGRLAFEKATCMLFPNLTHYEEGLKPLSALEGHFS